MRRLSTGVDRDGDSCADPPARRRGAASYDRLRQLLTSYGDDADGIECDYVGWHAHMAWREIDQAFALIRRYAGKKPIHVDDMWSNILLSDRADAPGETQFFAGGAALEGDSPNSLVPSYGALRNGVLNGDAAVRAWYDARHSRTLIKALVEALASAFGEGAERAPRARPAPRPKRCRRPAAC